MIEFFCNQNLLLVATLQKLLKILIFIFCNFNSSFFQNNLHFNILWLSKNIIVFFFVFYFQKVIMDRKISSMNKNYNLFLRVGYISSSNSLTINVLQVKTDMLDIKYTLFEVSLASGSCSSEKGWSIPFPYSSVNCESH